MQLVVLAMVMGILAHDANWASRAAGTPQHAHLLGLVLLPKLALALIFAAACYWTRRRLVTAGAHTSLRWLDRLAGIYRWAVLVLFSLDLYSGALVVLRQTLGDWIVVDEALVMLPTLAMLGWSWWCYYPIDRRLRQATLMGQIDRGGPVYPIWTRGQFLLSQFRHQVALVLAPLLVLMGWMEAVAMMDLGGWSVWPYDPRPLLVVLGAGGVFVAAPVMIRRIWDTVPLPPGDLRQRLLAMCQFHGVGIRELLLWRTFGGIVNAAVMGLFAPVRYILLTDALLDTVPTRQVEAVMAHELAHVKRRHLFWLLAIAAASLGLLQVGWDLAARWLLELLPMDAGSDAGWLAWALEPEHVAVAGSLAALLCWLAVFGWVSRRFERQADTFAVQHLAWEHYRGQMLQNPEARPTVDPAASHAMVLALQAVADLNHIPVRRRSWRHGSIQWRQDYLRSLVGQPIEDLSIDRQVLVLKGLGALGLLWLIFLAVLGV